MARIVFTALVSKITGKLAGSVIQGGQYGMILKSNKWRCNSAYKGIQDWKIKTGNVFHLWKRLTPQEKSAWKAAAAAVPIIRPDGSTYKLSGYMQFTKINLPLAAADQPLQPTPDGPAPAVYVQNLSVQSVWNSQTDFTMSVSFELINPEQVLILDILASPPVPVGQQPADNTYFYLGTYDAQTGQVDFGQDYAGNVNDWPYNTVVWFKFLFYLVNPQENAQIISKNAVATHDPLVPPYLDITADVTDYQSPSDFSLQTTVFRYDETFNYTVSYYLSAGVPESAPRPPADCRFIGTFQGDVGQHQFPDLWRNVFGSWPVGTIIYGYALVSPIGVGGPVQTIDLLFVQ